jgi:putative transposase
MTRKLNHSLPLLTRPEEARFFITICTKTRGVNRLCQPVIGEGILESVRWRNENKRWWCSIVLVMPDHVHLVLNFPPETRMEAAICEWKGWLAKKYRIEWQLDFFDHRLRGGESGEAKFQYILHNPVRAGLVGKPDDWPWRWIPVG